MKIGFVGNTNNYPFMLALALKRLGHEITFIIDSSEKLHRPENYAPTGDLIGINIHDFPGVIQKFHNLLFYSEDVKRICRLISDQDAVIANGIWPIVARSTGKPYIALLTGSDLEVYGNLSFLMRDYWKQSEHLPLYRKLIRTAIAGAVGWKQSRAIKFASAFNYFPPGIVPNGDLIIKKIRPQGQRLSFMMTDVQRRTLSTPPLNKTPRVFLTARHTWALPHKEGTCPLDYKGNDIFLKGVALFKEKTGLPLDVVLVKKGLDVEESRKLISQLAIEDYVTWLDEMTQKEVFQQYCDADIVADQFATSMIGMGAMDAMAIGRPLIAHCHPEVLEKHLGVRTPICQASTPEEVCAQLVRLYEPSSRKKIGEESHDFAKKYLSSEYAAVQCVQVLTHA